MLDTNALIDRIKNKPPLMAERIYALVDGDGLCMSFASYAVLLKGAERSERKSVVLRRLEALTRQVAGAVRHRARAVPALRDAGDTAQSGRQARSSAAMTCKLPATRWPRRPAW